MPSLADTIQEKQALYTGLTAQITQAEASAQGARAQLQAVARALAELRQTEAEVAETNARTAKAAADAQAQISSAAVELAELDKGLEALKAGLPAALTAVEADAIASPPEPGRTLLSEYDSAVAAAAKAVLDEQPSLQAARDAKAAALSALHLAEAGGTAARIALDTAIAALVETIGRCAAARSEKRHADAAALRFRLKRQKAVVEARKKVVEDAVKAVASAADALAEKQKDVEKAEKDVADLAAALAAEEALAASAQALVERAVRAKVP